LSGMPLLAEPEEREVPLKFMKTGGTLRRG